MWLNGISMVKLHLTRIWEPVSSSLITRLYRFGKPMAAHIIWVNGVISAFLTGSKGYRTKGRRVPSRHAGGSHLEYCFYLRLTSDFQVGWRWRRASWIFKVLQPYMKNSRRGLGRAAHWRDGPRAKAATLHIRTAVTWKWDLARSVCLVSKVELRPIYGFSHILVSARGL